jgi:murein DD-endopeptidase MepM/ murein hydrolase activator NlpD
MVRLGIAASLIAVSLVSSIGTAFVVKRRQPVQTARLEQKNQLLQSEIRQIRSQVSSLKTNVNALSQQDERLRLVAGLEPLNADVQRVGIGGPGGEEPAEGALRKLDRNAAELASSTSSQVAELLRRAKLLSFSWRESRDSLEAMHDKMAAMPSIVPTDGFISSAFSHSRWHPLLDRARPHVGLDIAAPIGTPIKASAKGVVTRVGYDGDYGYMVEIDHGYGLVTRYAHASRTLVERGQHVKRGEKIALVGETGLASGPHLHYEVLVNGQPANPRKYFLNLDVIAD